MSEETDHGVGSMVMGDEHKSDGRSVTETQGQRGPALDHSTVMMTGDKLPGGSKQVSEAGENEAVPKEDFISSPLGSFQSLCSSQSSEEGMRDKNDTLCSSFKGN